MKTKLATALATLIFCCILNAQSQTIVKPNEQGIYKSLTLPKDSTKAKETGKFYEDTKGNLYPIYKSENGAYFIIRVSKSTNNMYRQYLKLD